jgi:hypothetical protein
MEWQHVAMSIEHQSGNSEVILYVKGEVAEKYLVPNLLLVDSDEFDHFIGGTRKHWKLDNPFKGFMYNFTASNLVKADLSAGFEESCDISDPPVCKTCLPSVTVGDPNCLSECFYSQYVDTDDSCKPCSGYSFCNICGSKCLPCSRYDDSMCTED